MATPRRNRPGKPAAGDDTALAAYRAKRDPARTPEPMGAPRPSRQQDQGRPSFVIQEHHARALHWDFRLEHDGVLISWALPKGVPEDPATNHLAVHTEDHPLEYGSFEGDIGKGEYGGGRVTIWDHGEYELEKWTEREVKVVLHGSRAQGRYVLFATGGKNWMIHRMDPARAGFQPLPERIQPMLAVPGSLPGSDDGWAYEVKWDGVRAIVYVSGGRARALSRNDKDITGSFPELREAGEQLGARPAVLDGELVALGPDGRPSFGLLQQRLHLSDRSQVTRRAREIPATYVVFDVLHLDGRSLLHLSYDERREHLESLGLSGGSLQDQTRRHKRHHAGASRQRARAGQNPKRGEGSRGSLAAHAFPGRQAQPDISFHLGGQPVPGDGRQFIQRDQVVARRCERLYLVAALAATSQVTLRTPAGEPTEVLAGVKSQNGLIRMRHGFLFSI